MKEANELAFLDGSMNSFLEPGNFRNQTFYCCLFGRDELGKHIIQEFWEEPGPTLRVTQRPLSRGTDSNGQTRY